MLQRYRTGERRRRPNPYPSRCPVRFVVRCVCVDCVLSLCLTSCVYVFVCSLQLLCNVSRVSRRTNEACSNACSMNVRMRIRYLARKCHLHSIYCDIIHICSESCMRASCLISNPSYSKRNRAHRFMIATAKKAQCFVHCQLTLFVLI